MNDRARETKQLCLHMHEFVYAFVSMNDSCVLYTHESVCVHLCVCELTGVSVPLKRQRHVDTLQEPKGLEYSPILGTIVHMA